MTRDRIKHVEELARMNSHVQTRRGEGPVVDQQLGAMAGQEAHPHGLLQCRRVVEIANQAVGVQDQDRVRRELHPDKGTCG